MFESQQNSLSFSSCIKLVSLILRSVELELFKCAYFLHRKLCGFAFHILNSAVQWDIHILNSAAQWDIHILNSAAQWNILIPNSAATWGIYTKQCHLAHFGYKESWIW